MRKSYFYFIVSIQVLILFFLVFTILFPFPIGYQTKTNLIYGNFSGILEFKLGNGYLCDNNMIYGVEDPLMSLYSYNLGDLITCNGFLRGTTLNCYLGFEEFIGEDFFCEPITVTLPITHYSERSYLHFDNKTLLEYYISSTNENIFILKFDEFEAYYAIDDFDIEFQEGTKYNFLGMLIYFEEDPFVRIFEIDSI